MDLRVVVFLMLGGLLLGVCEAAFQTVCRVDYPSKVKNCDVFKNCTYIVSPVEEAENLAASSLGTNNLLFALYGGPSSCGYFEKLIETPRGREELTETIDKKRQTCGLRGVELQCGPGLSQIAKQNYAEFLKTLRAKLATYIIAVRLSSADCDRRFVESLNKYVDLVIVDSKGCAAQQYTVQHLIANGLSSQKIVYYVSLPLVLDCSSPQPLLTIKNAVVSIDSLNLYGAYMPLDYDDAIGICDEDGPYFLFRHLVALLKACGSHPSQPTTRCTTCNNNNGNGREPRDCSCCNNGSQNGQKCPKNMAFDACSSSCQPMIKVNCNATTCIMTGAIEGLDKDFIPFPHPFNFNKPNTSVAFNLTNITIIKDHIYELERLLSTTDLNRTIGWLNHMTGPLQKDIGILVSELNTCLENLVGMNKAIGDTSAPLGALKPLLDKVAAALKPLFELLAKLVGGLLGDPAAGNPMDALGSVLGGGGGGAAPGVPAGIPAAPAAPAVPAAPAGLPPAPAAPAAPALPGLP